jgi:hypothetical protein
MQEKAVYHRTLSKEETLLVVGLRLPGNFKTGKTKYYDVTIACRDCKNQHTEIVKMVEYSDGSWMKELEWKDDVRPEVMEAITVWKDICIGCMTQVDRTDIVKYYQRYISENCKYIRSCKFSPDKSQVEIYGLVISAAYRAAHFSGNPQEWRTYLPSNVAKMFGEEV